MARRNLKETPLSQLPLQDLYKSQQHIDLPSYGKALDCNSNLLPIRTPNGKSSSMLPTNGDARDERSNQSRWKGQKQLHVWKGAPVEAQSPRYHDRRCREDELESTQLVLHICV
ncbi:hypothetical protein EGR_00924 [Echinococcus granulosus]|uniref:Uncharacterized protein n=1 Tax=Echinococcus granulosus TaxID=6210 RepID=W6URM4_ECHGR|nr:hypothetical protein EGR_00924 [Echinococcus granulosus]EUB64380.1 hypothetical protein EGR_00924 [Echinococcus granulosus]